MLEAHLHPVLSSIPFALLTLALAAEFYSVWRKRESVDLISWSIVGAVLAIVAAFLSGYLAADYANSQLSIAADDISLHHLYGKGLLILAILTLTLFFVAQRAMYNRVIFRMVFRVLLVSLWLFSMITGYRGGELLLRPRVILAP